MSMSAPFSPVPDDSTQPASESPGAAQGDDDALRPEEDGVLGEDALDAALEDRDEPTFRPPQP